MEPTQRKMKILEAVVETFIITGEPVGSKALCEMLEFSVSPATIRNDMAELASLGFLEQPHTSSGRVPTELGYRAYLDKLMKVAPLTKRQQNVIDDTLYADADTPERLLDNAAAMLSKITGCMAVATSPNGENALIKRIRIVQTGSRTAMVVLITSAGSVKTKLFRCEFVITDEITERLERVINERWSNVSVVSITPALMQTAAGSLGEMSMLMPGGFTAIEEAAKEAASTNVAIKGQSNLFIMPELKAENAKRIMELLGHYSVQLARLISSETAKARVLLGSEINNPALMKLSIVASRYNASPECSGALALIGPIRMNYSKAISTIEYVTFAVGKMLNEMIDGE